MKKVVVFVLLLFSTSFLVLGVDPYCLYLAEDGTTTLPAGTTAIDFGAGTVNDNGVKTEGGIFGLHCGFVGVRPYVMTYTCGWQVPGGADGSGVDYYKGPAIIGSCDYGCSGGVCNFPDASCSDGILNGDEIAVDCGGSCGSCLGSDCSANSDCASGNCDQLLCAVEVETVCGDNWDNDGDGLTDCLDNDCVLAVTAGDSLCASDDFDGDGLSNVYELFFPPISNPLLPDTDSDGVCDGSFDMLDICCAGPDTNALPDSCLPNTAPVANDDVYDVASTGISIPEIGGVLVNDVDVDGDVIIINNPGGIGIGYSYGVLSFFDHGGFYYNPNGFMGEVSFNYWVHDGKLSGNSATVTINALGCSDGRIDGAETCDDGNLNNGDGCSSSCLLEPGYVCLLGSPCLAMSEVVNHILGVSTLANDVVGTFDCDGAVDVLDLVRIIKRVNDPTFDLSCS